MLEVGLGVLVIGVEGVCCKPKGWFGIVAILWHFSASLIQRHARLLRVLKKSGNYVGE
jgi:hypothetical protein